MKIITWNVNGVRAALKKGSLDWAWDQDPDLLCLQEVKARPDQLTKDQTSSLRLPYIWNPAERPGYSGVATFYKNQPMDYQIGMGRRSLIQRDASFPRFKLVSTYSTFTSRVVSAAKNA